MGFPGASAEAAAAERWMISPGIKRFIRPALFLPHQLEKIRSTEFGNVAEVVRGFKGNYESYQSPTWGVLLTDVDLIDGTIYTGRGASVLRPDRRRLPIYVRPKRVMKQGSLFESWMGNRWFGMWLLDDCLTYSLAQEHGQPVRTMAAQSPHQRQYAERLGFHMQPVEDTHFEELTIFLDQGQNDSKRVRADRIRQKLAGAADKQRHPGVFLLRGRTGELRLLLNEWEIAERLATEYGLTVLDPATVPLSQMLHACAGARVIVGVEGSHLTHGSMVMPNDAALLVIQPPDRVLPLLKISCDRQGQKFAFVVGNGPKHGFHVDWQDVAKTMDLVCA